jgi:Pollen protein Ole e 1 like
MAQRKEEKEIIVHLYLVATHMFSSYLLLIHTIILNFTVSVLYPNVNFGLISGAQVRINCNFKVNSGPHEEISITADKTTDQYGTYRFDIPPIDGFECKVGREINSFCKASLIGNSLSALCNILAVTASAEQVSICQPQTDACIYNLNALYYRPEKNVIVLAQAKLIQNTIL